MAKKRRAGAAAPARGKSVPAKSVRAKSVRTKSVRAKSVRAVLGSAVAKPKAKPKDSTKDRTKDKPKGGPVPGTPSPMRTRMTAELKAHVRRLYEETEQPICQIALDVGVNESVIRRMGPREGWVRFVAPPRDLPPIATLLAQVEALEAAAKTEPHASPPSTTAPDLDLSPPRASLAGEGERQDNIARFTQVVIAHLDEFEAVRRDGKLLPKHHLITARAISILTEAFNKLQRLRAAQPGSIHDDSADNADYSSADLDVYRLELTRRIEAFIAGRADTGAAGGPAAEAAEGV